MDDSLRRKLALLAERVEGQDISIIKEVRLDHRIEELSNVTRDTLCEAIAQVLSRKPQHVKEKLAEYENSDQILDDLVLGFRKP